MWGFAHLSARRGAFLVTIAVQKSKGVADEHNAARAFVKTRRLDALVGTSDGIADMIAVIVTPHDLCGPKTSSADYRALECLCGGSVPRPVGCSIRS